ncbi:DNA gyrase inhibitor YacG [Sphingomonas sp. ID1715]|uniref:DNA gyrase inhibitor YacG n=1 Tax=Sphingomonas sp. ID1715 TaxID=1656898 RepID=UPI001488A549|nr:DNA gyrase inhibitor YacG [Sphingomonas sp. ID1715]NNM77033.1 DNA gyrase inhibitor YacG [Sphingomonas sp. ID1715]
MAATCPLCDKPADPAHQPFCSRGCKDRDLLRWLGEGYRVPGPPATEHKPLDSEL